MTSADVLALSSFPPPNFDPVDNTSSSKRKRDADRKASIPLINMATLDQPKKQEFDPAKHLSFTPPSRTYSMEEIGLPNKGISPVAVSEPFPLFTLDAIKQMRAEVLSKDVLENCQ